MKGISVHCRRLLNILLGSGGPVSVLDIGAGDCQIAVALAEAGHDVVAVDRSLALGSGECADVEIEGTGCLRVARADIRGLTLPASFDRVVLLGVLHYANDPGEAEDVLKAAVRHTRSGGKIGLSWILMTEPPRASEPLPPSQAFVHGILSRYGLTQEIAWTVEVVHREVVELHRHWIAYEVWSGV